MNIYRLTYRDENPYHGCYDCVKRREQQLATREGIKYYTSRFFLVVGVAIRGRHSLTLENSPLENPFAACAAVAGCGFLCGIGVSETLGWCYHKCFLQDRLCQHIRNVPLYFVSNTPPDAQAAQVPTADAQAAQAPAADTQAAQAATADTQAAQAATADTQVAQASAAATQVAQADANTESSPPDNHKPGVGFVTDRLRFRQQFSRAIET